MKYSYLLEQYIFDQPKIYIFAGRTIYPISDKSIHETNTFQFQFPWKWIP